MIGKVIPLDKIEDNFQLIKRYNMDVIAYFSLGHPEETLLDMEETINVIRRLKPDYMDVALCSPIPGSRLFDIAVREGKLPKDFWDKVDKIEMLPVYIPAGLTLKDMRELQKQAYRKFYFNCNYIISQARKIKNLKDFKNKFKIALLLWKEACR